MTPTIDLMTAKEAAEYLHIPLHTVYNLARRGQFPAVRIGRRWRISRSELHAGIYLSVKEAGPPVAMIVEDDPALQTLFKRLLKEAGFGRLVFGSGKEAIAMSRKQRFDFALLDLELPDIPGDEVFRQLKEFYPSMPIIVITGHPEGEILSRILTFGPLIVINKPVEHEQINRAVEQLGHKGPDTGL